jgi:hypothetical protein
MLDDIESRMVNDALTADDAKNLSEIVSDAQILVGLIIELDRTRVQAVARELTFK